ncbi:MAG: hypothetical protein JWP69_2301 [Flaviaesturariibacter sp.]|nr:hypothetical protein [Flaviaesturariibacter sp.]
MRHEALHQQTDTITFENARTLRKAATEAEAILWNALRGRKLLNLKFRRQHTLQHYIADFYCHELKLVIEVDGGYHNTAEEIAYDVQRTEEFEKEGIVVLRLKNEEVEQLDSALQKIISFIGGLKVPSPKGEG